MKKVLSIVCLGLAAIFAGSVVTVPGAKAAVLAQNGPYTPKPGSADREMICDAVRLHLKRNRKFVVHYLQVKGEFGFFRGNEVVPVKGGTKETDFQVMALVDRVQRAGETFWFVSEYCTLDDQAKYDDFKEQCKKRVAEDGVPMDIFPAGIVE